MASKLRWYQATFTYENFGTGEVDTEVHWFPLEPNPKRSTYPAVTSLSWFRERSKLIGTWVVLESLDFVLKGEAIRQQRATPADPYIYQFANDPHFYQESLWAFYESIGYDRKKNKWGPRPPLPKRMTLEQLQAFRQGVDLACSEIHGEA